MPQRGLDGGLKLGRNIRGFRAFRKGLAMVAQHGTGMFALDVGDLPGSRLQAIFLPHPCVDFAVGGEAADRYIFGRLVVYVDEFPAPFAVCPYSEWTLSFTAHKTLL